MKSSNGLIKDITKTKEVPLIAQFPVGLHPYITNVVDVKADGHYGYCTLGLLSA